MLSGCPCVGASFRQKPCKLGFWNFIYGFLMEKYLTHVFFSCLSYRPLWNYALLNKIRMKSDACHILWTVHARVLKFLIWIPHGKIADHIFFLSKLPPLLALYPFEKIRMKSCQQDISKSIWARGLKLGQMIGNDEEITCLKYQKKNHLIFLELWHFENFSILKKSEWHLFSNISRKVFELRAWNLVSW